MMTGGGKPQPPANNSSSLIVEAVLGPALEGMTNMYDCDGPDFNEVDNISEPIHNIGNGIMVQTSGDEQCSTEPIIIDIKENENKSQLLQDDNEVMPSTSKKTEETQKTDQSMNKELWETWTPTSLKRPLAESLRPSNSGGRKWLQRRRPRTAGSLDALTKEKIELVRTLKKYAEEEGRLRVQILKEQLKQEKIKTKKKIIIRLNCFHFRFKMDMIVLWRYHNSHSTQSLLDE